MAAPVYATSADLTAYCAPDPAPAGVGARQLRDASAQVDEILLTAIYDRDADEQPTDPRVAAAMRDATCAQALHVNLYGDEVEIREASGPVSLGPLSLGGRQSSGSSGAGASVPVWAPKAVAVLRAEGLIVGPVQT